MKQPMLLPGTAQSDGPAELTDLPSATWRMLAERSAGEGLPKGLDAIWDTASGVLARRNARPARFLESAKRVLGWDKHFAEKSDAKLKEDALEFRNIFRCKRETQDDLERAFALIREVAARTLGEKPYLVQVAGAMAIEAGCIAEMATGEGKTLTATMPATIGGWRGKGCHVITSNDYLAERDADWMSQIYGFCGLTTGHVGPEMSSPDRRNAYRADITYCTNKEVTADFLRDQLALGRLRGLPQALLAKLAEGAGKGTDRLVQRGLHTAIIDEADSILIDEAVTPLIISGEAPNEEQVDAFGHAASMAGELLLGTHYSVDERYREINLTSAGETAVRDLSRNLGGVWSGKRRREELIVQALTAKELYQLDKQYVIQEDKIVIVDEFTGRLMPDREWRDGLHQAVEAKEGLEVNPPKDTYARASFQRFFRMYPHLSGMTGTASEATREFWQIYHLPVVVIPTNKPCKRIHLPDRVFTTQNAKWQAVVEECIKVHRTGRPILLGTRSVGDSERLSQMLSQHNLEHQVLNAVRHKEEASIVAEAGQEGKITVATNMAGRGTNIKLGRGLNEKGGLHVVVTQRHEAGRIDRQLYGRCSRQGENGSAHAFVSLEDELAARYMPRITAMLRRKHGLGDKEISTKLNRQVFEHAQRKAERMALSQRKGVLRTDDWLDEYLGFAGSEG